jgi:NTE family protein
MIAVNVNAYIPYQKPAVEAPELAYIEQLNSGKLSFFQSRLNMLFPASRKESTGYFNLIGESSSLMLSQITKLTLQLNPPDLLIEVSRNACGTFDFYKATELIEAGKEATKECLEKMPK